MSNPKGFWSDADKMARSRKDNIGGSKGPGIPKPMVARRKPCSPQEQKTPSAD
jgi:hypothetical protein